MYVFCGRYQRYLEEDIQEANIETMGKEQLDLIKTKCSNPAWFKSLMLKKKVSQLDQEVKEDYVEASKKAVLNYIMLDPEEKERLKILVLPKVWSPLVVRAPVPWHQSFLQARQYCRHNLFALNVVMNKLNALWWRRYNSLR